MECIKASKLQAIYSITNYDKQQVKVHNISHRKHDTMF